MTNLPATRSNGIDGSTTVAASVRYHRHPRSAGALWRRGSQTTAGGRGGQRGWMQVHGVSMLAGLKAEAAADSFTVCVADPPAAGCILLVRCTLITPLLRCDSRSRYVRPHTTTGSCTTTTATPSPALAWKVPGNPSHAHARCSRIILLAACGVFQMCPGLMPHRETRPSGGACRHSTAASTCTWRAWEARRELQARGGRTPLALLQSEVRISQSAR